MADLKISQLPVATTPLAGTELVPIVQGATTKQTTAAALLTGTVPSGTANGVLYLNGSKVVTSGSGLTFDGMLLSINGGTNGTCFAVKGTGAFAGFDTGAANDGRIEYAYNGANTFYTGIDSASLFTLMARSGVSLAFGANGSEQMRLTSTGLGIGTSSPTSKLTVSGSAALSRIGLNANPIDAVSTAQSFIRFQSTGGDFYIGTESATGGAFFSSSTAYAAILYNSNATPMQFYTAGALRATLDSSGNLGLGVTPSAWDTAIYRTFQIGTGAGSASLSGRTDNANNASFGVNFYYGSGSLRYVANGLATFYNQQNGTHSWHNAPNNTSGAGATAPFTQALTLTAASNLLLGGTNDPGGANAFYIANTASVPGTPTSGGVLYVESGALKYKGSSGTVTTIANA
jgi:hypothetical protein